MHYLGIYDISLNVIADKETVKGYMVSARGFHNNNRLGQRTKEFEKLRETFRRHRIITRRDSFSIIIKDTKMEVFLRDINTNKVFHSATSFYRNFKSPTPSSHVAGALVAQPTHWELRDRGTDSFGGFEAYKQWSPCPSLILSISSTPCIYTCVYI